MGKILGAVAVGALTVATGGTFLGFTGLTAGLLSAASSLVLSGITSALAPKPKASEFSSAAFSQDGGLTRQIRQPITARRIVYGEVRASGPYAFIGSTSSNQYLHFILMVAAHEVEEIGEIWINDESITPDWINANGDVEVGKYSGYVRIKKVLGSDTQGALPDMMTAFPEWTENHRLQGIAYIYVRLLYNRDVWAGGIPNVSAWLRGKRTLDPRSETTYYNQNPVLMVNDYLTDSSLGLGANSSNIEQDFLISGANTSEEFVTTTTLIHEVTIVDTTKNLFSLNGDTLQFQRGDRVNVLSTGTLPAGITDSSTDYYAVPYQRLQYPRIGIAETYEDALAGNLVDITTVGSGTITVQKNAEPRYVACGAVDVDGQPHEIISGMLSSMAGKAVYGGGRWRLLVGKYETPTILFDENDLAGPIIVKTKISRADRFNRVYGTYTSPLNNSQPTDYPVVKNDFYADQDGQIISTKIDLPFTPRPHMAQRIVKIELEKGRQEIVFTARYKLTAFKCQTGDNVLINNMRYGWTEKPFEVIEWALQIEDQAGVPVPYIEMKLKETAPECYDWNNGEETAVDPAPNTTIPNAFDIDAVSGLSFDSIGLTTAASDIIYTLILAWDIHPDAFVQQGGQYEIQYKLSVDVNYQPSFFVDGLIRSSIIATASAGTTYDIRIRAINNVGVRGPWNYLLGVVTGTGGGVTDSEDWGNFTDSPSSSEDWGDFLSSTSGDEDWGGFL